MNGYIYLIKEREFIKTNERIYKLGHTRKSYVNNRLIKYPKNSKLILVFTTDNPRQIETKIKNIFKIIFIHRTDIGLEYFEGDEHSMLYALKLFF